MRTSIRRLALLALGLLLLLTACSTSGGDGDSSGAGEADVAEAADAEAAPQAGGESAAGPDDEASAGIDLTAAAEDRQIVSTATVSLRVDELDAAVEQVGGVVEEVGGLVFAENTDLRDGAVTHLTIKVPPDSFRDALATLADVGEVETQTVTTDDVTEQVVDLDSRIRTAEASVDRLRLLLDRAERIADITTIEGQLLQRETDLETLRGQRRTIERQVALATIDVTLSADRTSPPPPEDDSQPGFVEGLKGGAGALRVVAIGLSAVAGALLPWSPVLLVGAFALWRATRRRAPSGG